MKEELTVEKKQTIINDIPKETEYWVAFSKGMYMSGFHLKEYQVKELLLKLQDILK